MLGSVLAGICKKSYKISIPGCVSDIDLSQTEIEVEGRRQSVHIQLGHSYLHSRIELAHLTGRGRSAGAFSPLDGTARCGALSRTLHWTEGLVAVSVAAAS